MTCRCGHPLECHNADNDRGMPDACSWSWEDSDGFGYVCECSEYLSR